ncbi:MAG: peptidylprolyl isomerase [Alphaproteobacteria bacterium]
MRLFRWRNGALVLLALATFTTQTLTVRAATLENTIYLDLKDGRVVIELWPDVAPKHVERIKALARQKFYDGVVFHRVIDGFMAQTGDPTGTGMGGSELPDLPAEFNSAFHVEGTLSMARSSSPDSANSQFFICFAPAPFLDGQYTAWGKVVDGMELVHRIKKGDSNQNGSVDNPDKIIQMRVAADIEKKPKSKQKVKPKATK